ncbi:MAG: 8-oxo-dGTP diphosphatase [Chlamydiota bacterium]
MRYKPIIGTLGYVLSPDKSKVLMVHRIARDSDDHLGKYNGLGGKMESNEDVHSGMVREIQEEAGIICTDISLRGTINWTGFGPNGEDWLCFVFLIKEFKGTPFKKNIEGNLEWIERDQLMQLPLWEGDRHFIPLVFDENPRLFHIYMPYDGDRMIDWSLTR